jgi:two-component system chemotaxis response regulator CheB
MQENPSTIPAQLTGASLSPSAGRDIVVIGASAGGIQVLLRILQSLPETFDAAVLVAVHIGSRRSLLPQILNRAGPLAVDFGKHGEPIQSGRVYVAPPDQHMLVADGHIELSGGARENHFRPAIDPLFRTAAAAYGDRLVGLVLSGALSDGTVGLAAIKARGGITIVQDPAEALVTGMPASAISAGGIDLVLSSQELIDRLPSIVRARPVAPEPPRERMSTSEPPEHGVIRESLQAQAADIPHAGATLFTCPDCGGTLWQADEEGILRFQCHVGHGWNWEALLVQKSDQLEAALWAASRLFVERSILQRQIAARLLSADAEPAHVDELEALSLADERRSHDIQTMLEELSLAASKQQSSVASSPEPFEARERRLAPKSSD